MTNWYGLVTQNTMITKESAMLMIGCAIVVFFVYLLNEANASHELGKVMVTIGISISIASGIMGMAMWYIHTLKG